MHRGRYFPRATTVEVHMGSSRFLRVVLLALCGVLVAISVGGANAALVKVGSLVLTADGGFHPQKLPKHSYEPIDFQGRADVHNTEGGPPPALEEVLIDFDRDGKIETKGLPVCRPAQIAHATTPAARRICGDSLVGTATVGAMIDVAGIEVQANQPASLFNGPRKNGGLTLVGHTYTDFPVPRTYVVLISLERRHGAYSYRIRLNIPTLSAGVFTHIDGRIGRRYEFHGADRSFVSARCSSGVIRTHGRFTFADGTIIDGAIEKPCFPKE